MSEIGTEDAIKPGTYCRSVNKRFKQCRNSRFNGNEYPLAPLLSIVKQVNKKNTSKFLVI